MVILRQLNVLLKRYGQKRCFVGFEISFTAISCFFGHFGDYFVWTDVPLPRYARKCSSLALKTVLRHLPFFFDHFTGYFASIRRIVAKIQAKTLLCQFWNCFTAFFVNIWALWWLFCVNLTYHCKDTGENVFSPYLKQVLWHWSFFWALWLVFCVNLMYCCQDVCKKVPCRLWKRFYGIRCFFDHFRGYFTSITHIVAKVIVKTLLYRFWNRFYSIFPSFLSHLAVILRQSDVLLPR